MQVSESLVDIQSFPEPSSHGSKVWLKGAGIPLNVHEMETSGEVQLSVAFDLSSRVNVFTHSPKPKEQNTLEY